MTEYKRKLIEVALPLDAINKESAREKSIRQGHPSTLHLWWARRPLAACRAVLFASLVDDPSAWPDKFPTEADQEAERKRLFAIIESLIKWDNSNNPHVLASAQAEIMRSCQGRPPTVLDPFCGGGSIALEAQRLGLSSEASDLNPVAVLITKALVEIPAEVSGLSPVNPNARSVSLGGWTRAHGLMDDIRYYGLWVRDQAQSRIGQLYPKVRVVPEYGSGEATALAWIWARTVKCPNPACAARMPLISSFDLSTKPGRERWVDPIVDRAKGTIDWRIGGPTGPRPKPVKLGQGARFRCLICDQVAPSDYVHSEIDAGRAEPELIAIVADSAGGRIYLPPSSDAVGSLAEAHQLKEALDAGNALPREEGRGTFGGNAQGRRYGFRTFADYFTDRQLVTLATFVSLVSEAEQRVVADGGTSRYAAAVATYLALGVSRMADMLNSLASWKPSMDQAIHMFTRQAIPMVWDFAEVNPFAHASGDLETSLGTICKVLDRLPASAPAKVILRDAVSAAYQMDSAMVVTDPPYYDNISYSDLSDFFYVWLRRSIGTDYPDLFATVLTPKAAELVANPYRFGGKVEAEEHFERGFGQAFKQLRGSQAAEYPLSLFYAFKQSEDGAAVGQVASTGWETMLAGLLQAGFSIHGTWPIRSELGNRSTASGTNALASSVVLVCRPRAIQASLTTRKEFLTTLKSELPSALRRLQQGNIAPVDLAQAAIGPGMAVFSKYAKVVEADGSPMTVRVALGIINEALDETLAAQEGDFDAATRWAVAWFEQFGIEPGAFGVAETLSKAKNTAVNALVDAGIVEARAGKVRLVSRDQLPIDWDPTQDDGLTVWGITQHLIRALEGGGDEAVARLVNRIGGFSEGARGLAYRVYNICERRRWAKEALSYNGLVVAWPAIVRIAADESGQSVQLSLEG